jgi:hypothetical protein
VKRDGRGFQIDGKTRIRREIARGRADLREEALEVLGYEAEHKSPSYCPRCPSSAYARPSRTFALPYMLVVGTPRSLHSQKSIIHQISVGPSRLCCMRPPAL